MPEYLFGSELIEMQEEMDEVEQLKIKIHQLHPDGITIIHTAVSKWLELKDNKQLLNLTALTNTKPFVMLKELKQYLKHNGGIIYVSVSRFALWNINGKTTIL